MFASVYLFLSYIFLAAPHLIFMSACMVLLCVSVTVVDEEYFFSFKMKNFDLFAIWVLSHKIEPRKDDIALAQCYRKIDSNVLCLIQ
jgi:hypothetical protein